MAWSFHPTTTQVVKTNVEIFDAYGRGPFCRLKVAGDIPLDPGVYAWVRDDAVMYVGKSTELRHEVQGAKISRPYNDYTYIPPSQVKRPFDPRVRINGLLNRSITEGFAVTWWWRTTSSAAESGSLEARLIANWRPPWNQTVPVALDGITGARMAMPNVLQSSSSLAQRRDRHSPAG
jgi:hypothetical protein